MPIEPQKLMLSVMPIAYIPGTKGSTLTADAKTHCYRQQGRKPRHIVEFHGSSACLAAPAKMMFWVL